MRHCGKWLKKELKFDLGMKTTSSTGYSLTFKPIFAFSQIVGHDLKKGWNFSFVWKLYQAGNTTELLYLLLPSGTFLNMTWKKFKLLLGMKTTSGWGCYLTFKSIFIFRDIPEHDLKKRSKFLLRMRATSSEGF